jgi:hypothetical protein
MSDHRSHRGVGEPRPSLRSRLRRALPWMGWAILVALLGGNLLLGLLRQKDDTPRGFITPAIVQTVAFWLPVLGSFVMCACAVVWSKKAFQHGERSSHLWAQRGGVAGLMGTLALAFATFDSATFRREWMVIVAAVVVGVQSFFLAMIAWREYRRSDSGESRRPKGLRRMTDEPPAGAPADAARPGASASSASSSSAPSSGTERKSTKA